LQESSFFYNQLQMLQLITSAKTNADEVSSHRHPTYFLSNKRADFRGRSAELRLPWLPERWFSVCSRDWVSSRAAGVWRTLERTSVCALKQVAILAAHRLDVSTRNH
jgi:hypothetical protein